MIKNVCARVRRGAAVLLGDGSLVPLDLGQHRGQLRLPTIPLRLLRLLADRTTPPAPLPPPPSPSTALAPAACRSACRGAPTARRGRAGSARSRTRRVSPHAALAPAAGRCAPRTLRSRRASRGWSTGPAAAASRPRGAGAASRRRRSRRAADPPTSVQPRDAVARGRWGRRAWMKIVLRVYELGRLVRCGCVAVWVCGWPAAAAARSSSRRRTRPRPRGQRCRPRLGTGRREVCGRCVGGVREVCGRCLAGEEEGSV